MSGHGSEQGIAWGQAVDGLRLGLSMEGKCAVLVIENQGPTEHRLLSHVKAGGEEHYDPFTVVIQEGDEERTLRFVADRDRSAQIWVGLEPAERLEHRVDLAAWALRAVNGERELERLDALSARYELEPGEGHWSGRLESGRIE